MMTALVTLTVSLMAQSALAGPPTTSPGPGAGQIVGSPAAPARDLYPVEIVAIDGENILPREVLWLEPGKYEFTVSATIVDPQGQRSLRRNPRFEERGLNKIEVVVEAGKTYHLAVRYTGEDRRAPYSTVVHRVEERQ
jgi:hypothetical protein